jgi:hypothetical protein
MKKKFIVALSVILCFALVFAFAGCAKTEDIDEATAKAQMETAFSDFKLDANFSVEVSMKMDGTEITTSTTLTGEGDSRVVKSVTSIKSVDEQNDKNYETRDVEGFIGKSGEKFYSLQKMTTKNYVDGTLVAADTVTSTESEEITKAEFDDYMAGVEALLKGQIGMDSTETMTESENAVITGTVTTKGKDTTYSIKITDEEGEGADKEITTGEIEIVNGKITKISSVTTEGTDAPKEIANMSVSFAYDVQAISMPDPADYEDAGEAA